MKKIRNTLLSRRGAAMEMAILVMFVVLALSVILVSNATLQKKNMDSSLEGIDNLELSSAGEQYLADKTELDGYEYDNTEDNGESIIIITRQETGAKLTITIEEDKITSWVISQ